MLVIILAADCLTAQSSEKSVLLKEYDLGKTRSAGTHYYEMQTDVITMAPDGKTTGRDIFKLYLSITLQDAEKESYNVICGKFILGLNGKGAVNLPALDNWSYTFNMTENGKNEKGEVFGIDHARFENLKDSEGKIVAIGNSYFTYNSFIDFHALMNVFAVKSIDGKGIQALCKIGDKVVHSASHSQAPVNLGKGIKEGSYFKNGEIVLNFKGLSAVNNKPMAIVNYDSGESEFNMIVAVTGKMETNSYGRSRYNGDIFIDTQTMWPAKIDLIEYVITETKIQSPAMKLNNVVERLVNIKEISKEEFAKNK